MRGATIILFLLIVSANSLTGGFCLVDDFEGYTVVQWYLHNGARYTFVHDAVSGNYSIRFSFGQCSHDSAETPYYPLSDSFSISLYFKPLNHYSVVEAPLYIVFDIVEAKATIKWWFTRDVKRLSNGSYLHTFWFMVKITVKNTSYSESATINYETRQEISSDELHFTKYRPTKWVHVYISYSNHNLTVKVNKTLSITVEHDPPSIKISIVPSCHYSTGVLIDKLEICGIKTSTWQIAQRNTIIAAAAAGFLAGLIPLLLLGKTTKTKRRRSVR